MRYTPDAQSSAHLEAYKIMITSRSTTISGDELESYTKNLQEFHAEMDKAASALPEPKSSSSIEKDFIVRRYPDANVMAGRDFGFMVVPTQGNPFSFVLPDQLFEYIPDSKSTIEDVFRYTRALFLRE